MYHTRDMLAKPIGKADGPWTLPVDLATLHNAVIAYGRHIQKEAEAKQVKMGNPSLSYEAISNLHRTAIVNHRAVRALCEAGWTPTTPTMIRTLLDILVSVFAVAHEAKDSDYMGFKYLAHSYIEGMFDPDLTADRVKENTAEVEKGKRRLKPVDIKRAEALVASYKEKTPPYWYSPEFPSPGATIKQRMPRNWDVWHYFSGSTHGAFAGSLMFSDFPDDAGIDPEENPRRTRSAIVGSSRLLLDVSFARGQFEGVAGLPEYQKIVKTYILPQKALL